MDGGQSLRRRVLDVIYGHLFLFIVLLSVSDYPTLRMTVRCGLNGTHTVK